MTKFKVTGRIEFEYEAEPKYYGTDDPEKIENRI